MSHEDYEKTACGGDCRLNNPIRCPCPERCASVTKIMRQQRRFLNHCMRYVRPREYRGRTRNLAECVIGFDMPYEHGYKAPFIHDDERITLIDSANGCKALVDISGIDPEHVRAMIESYFSCPAYEVLPGVWVA